MTWCILMEDLNAKSGQMFLSSYVFATKLGKQTVTYMYKLRCNLNRKVQCVSFVCLCFRLKCILFFNRRQVRSVLGLERRQTGLQFQLKVKLYSKKSSDFYWSP